MARYNPKVQSLGNFWTRRAIFKIKTALESPSHYAHFGVRHVALRRAAPKLSRRKAEKMVQKILGAWFIFNLLKCFFYFLIIFFLKLLRLWVNWLIHTDSFFK